MSEPAHPSSPSHDPIPLLALGQARSARDGQVPLRQLRLNHLPPTQGRLLLHGPNLGTVHLQVAQSLDVAPAFQQLGQPLRLGLLGSQRQNVPDGAGGAEFGVRYQGPRELIEAFSELQRPG